MIKFITLSYKYCFWNKTRTWTDGGQAGDWMGKWPSHRRWNRTTKKRQTNKCFTNLIKVPHISSHFFPTLNTGNKAELATTTTTTLLKVTIWALATVGSAVRQTSQRFVVFLFSLVMALLLYRRLRLVFVVFFLIKLSKTS